MLIEAEALEIEMYLPALLFLAAVLHPTVPPGGLTFHARVAADTSYTNETVWFRFEAENLTDTTLPVFPLSIVGPMAFDVFDSTGQSVIGTWPSGNYGVGDGDTLAPHGHQSGIASLNLWSKYHDTVSGENYFPPGLYRATFRWFYLATREIDIPRPHLEDSVGFRVVAPFGVEAEARDAYRRARAQRCPGIATALWSTSQTYNKSHYVDECLDVLLSFLGDPNCDVSGLNRETVAKRLVMAYSNHPTVIRRVKTVYTWSQIHKSKSVARQAMQDILDSVPPNSEAAEAVRKFLRDGIPRSKIE